MHESLKKTIKTLLKNTFYTEGGKPAVCGCNILYGINLTS